MENEYYRSYQALEERNSHRGQQWFGERKRLVEKYAWAIPSAKALQYISKHFNELIEVGAGTGYWAGLLGERGVNVRAIDPNGSSRWYDVEDTYASKIQSGIKDSPVLMVWPPVGDSLAYDVLTYQPSHVLYVGEPRGGCTASDAFFDRLSERYGQIEKTSIPSFDGVNDDLYHYSRNV